MVLTNHFHAQPLSAKPHTAKVTLKGKYLIFHKNLKCAVAQLQLGKTVKAFVLRGTEWQNRDALRTFVVVRGVVKTCSSVLFLIFLNALFTDCKKFS